MVYPILVGQGLHGPAGIIFIVYYYYYYYYYLFIFFTLFTADLKLLIYTEKNLCIASTVINCQTHIHLVTH